MNDATKPDKRDYDALQALESDALLRNRIKLGHMRMMVALDDSQQISTAASLLNITQPAASRMLSEMESILNVQLCERLPRGIELTPFGRTFARHARTILLELRETERELADLKSGKGGSIFMGSVTAPAISLAGPAIKKLKEKYPKIQISIQVETSNSLAQDLLASRLDFMLARIPDDLNPRLFESRVLGTESACLIVRKGHPLLTKFEVRLDEINAYDWVFQPGGSLLRRTIEAMFLSSNISLPEKIVNTSSLLMTLVMVAQSDTIAPIATDVAKFVTAQDGLAGSIGILPLNQPINLQPYSLITLRGRSLSPAAKQLSEIIMEDAGKME
eukprot:gene12184-biopygen7396